MAVPRTAVGRIELRAEKIGSAEFQRDFAKMVQNASILSFPFFLGTAALAPSLFHLWLKQQWQAGIVPAQLIVLGGVPMVLFYSFDAALLAGNLSSVVRRIADLQVVTVAATVLCAAPFGLIATCLALAVRPWLLLPVVFMIFRRATNIPSRIALLPCLRALIGAVIMAGLISLPFAHPTWMNGALEFALRVIGGNRVLFFLLIFLCARRLKRFLSAFVFRDTATKLNLSSHLVRILSRDGVVSPRRDWPRLDHLLPCKGAIEMNTMISQRDVNGLIAAGRLSIAVLVPCYNEEVRQFPALYAIFARRYPTQSSTFTITTRAIAPSRSCGWRSREYRDAPRKGTCRPPHVCRCRGRRLCHRRWR